MPRAEGTPVSVLAASFRRYSAILLNIGVVGGRAEENSNDDQSRAAQSEGLRKKKEAREKEKRNTPLLQYTT